MDESLFRLHSGNDDVHLGAFRNVSSRIQPDLAVVHDAFKRLRAHIQNCNGFQ